MNKKELMIESESNKQAKLKLQSSKKILEFSCFVKIERNGIEIKSKYLQINQPSSISIIENTYQADTGTEVNIPQLHIKNKALEMIYSCQLKHISKMIDRFINEGKLSIIITKDKDREMIFFSKTTLEILDNFISSIAKYIPALGRQQPLPKPEEPIHNPQQRLSNASNCTNKRKFHELYAKHNPTKLNPIKRGLEIPNQQRISIRIGNPYSKSINDMPIDLLFIIFEYVEKTVLMTKFSRLNKEIKSYADEYVEELIIRDDTPNKIFNRLITRFCNSKRLIFGKAKNFKNETIKNLDICLSNLEYLDLSDIIIVNDSALKRLFSKTKVTNITTLKLNFYLDSLYTGLIYINDFYKNITVLTIKSTLGAIDKEIDTLSKFPKYYHPNMFKTLFSIIGKEQSKLKELRIFTFNAAIPNSHLHLFKKLTVLEIDVLLIDQVKDLHIFHNCTSMMAFSIKHIAIHDLNTKTNKYSYTLMDFTQHGLNLSDQIVEMLDTLSIDFDNDYIEVFSKIFYYMKNLTSLCLGSFVTNDMCKLISVYLKKLARLSLSSMHITDEGIDVIFKECLLIKEINLEGCNRFLGSFFNDGIPPSLKKARFSIMTYNFNHLINYLNSKGVFAQNTIKTNM